MCGDPLGQTARQKLQQNQDLPMPPSGTKDTAIQAETAANEQKPPLSSLRLFSLVRQSPDGNSSITNSSSKAWHWQACKMHSIINSTPLIPITSYKFKSEFEVISSLGHTHHGKARKSSEILQKRTNFQCGGHDSRTELLSDLNLRPPDINLKP